MDIVKSIVLFLLRRKAEEISEDEEPLASKRIGLLKQYFNVVDYRYFDVISSANILIKSEIIKRLLLWLDYILFKYFPGFKLLGRTVVISLREPIK